MSKFGGIPIKNSSIKINNRYEMNQLIKIGSGSYSDVYMGRDIINDKVVAIKKIMMWKLNEKATRMINDEISIMEKIKNLYHKNIVECFDIIIKDSTVYMILEYCDCGDLSKLIGKPIKEEVVEYYFFQIIEALKFLQESKIIHRDIKPKNILLKNDRKELKLCDFGFAKLKSGMERVNTICGSPLYMAPELLEEKTYTDIVDVWAIGMILYEMLYGNHPYAKCRDIDDLKNFSQQDIKIPPENTKNKNINEKCIELLKKMLNKDENKRIALKELFTDPWITYLYEKFSGSQLSVNKPLTKIPEIPEVESNEISEVSDSENDNNENNDNEKSNIITGESSSNDEDELDGFEGNFFY